MIHLTDRKLVEMPYSILGFRIFSGDVYALRYLYGQVWKEMPVVLKIISLLQQNITANDIIKAADGKYSTEFYYYWGMLNLGEQSRLVFKDTNISENCFNKIKTKKLLVDARLAYVELLKSNEPVGSEENIERIDRLRQCAGRQDLFSQIAIARIVFYQFINECEKDEINSELPLKIWQYLERPCHLGHPVAMRFWNEIMTYLGTPMAMNRRMEMTRANSDILYDYKPEQTCK